jgi:Tat protein secretion system quality control protein TatD with DNase activity
MHKSGTYLFQEHAEEKTGTLIGEIGLDNLIFPSHFHLNHFHHQYRTLHVISTHLQLHIHSYESDEMCMHMQRYPHLNATAS